jgi:transcriptional regulator with XRE-family HTH domain
MWAMQQARPLSRRIVASVLRDLRINRGFTQERLEFISGLHRTYVSSTERGERNISFEALSRWLGALGVSWAEFGGEIDKRARKGAKH